MARKKQNIDMYGKSWKPVDLPNLQEAIKLYERLNYLQDHFAGSLSSSQAIMSQINEKTRIQERLQELNLGLSKEQSEAVAEALIAQQELNNAKKETNKLDSVSDTLNKVNSSSSQKSVKLSNFGSSVSGALQEKYANKVHTQIFNDLSKTYKSRGKSIQTEEFAEHFNSSVSNELSKSAGKFNTAANVLQVAANTFGSGVNTLKSLFFRRS